MVKINRIYTRNGDKGETALVGGATTLKDSLRVNAYGELDELNAVLGWARTLTAETTEASKSQPLDLSSLLKEIQQQIFDLGSQIATPPASGWAGMFQVTQPLIDSMEKQIDALCDGLPELRSFVLPGGSQSNAALHLARTVCRRAERTLWALSRTEKVEPLSLVYLNRLSDLLFAMARYESARTGVAEYLWEPKRS